MSHTLTMPHTLTRCLTVGTAARTQIGIHHTNPRRVRALWRAHKRSLQRGEGGGGGGGDGDGTEGGGVHLLEGGRNTTAAIADPAEPVQCMISDGGDPGDVWQLSDHRYLDRWRPCP